MSNPVYLAEVLDDMMKRFSPSNLSGGESARVHPTIQFDGNGNNSVRPGDTSAPAQNLLSGSVRDRTADLASQSEPGVLSKP